MLPVETFSPAFKFAAPPLTVNPPTKVPNPEFETLNKLDAPLLTLKLVPPGCTEAEIDPDDIRLVDTLSPTTAEAGILNKPAPDPEKY